MALRCCCISPQSHRHHERGHKLTCPHSTAGIGTRAIPSMAHAFSEPMDTPCAVLLLSEGILLIPDQLHVTSSTSPQVLLSHRCWRGPVHTAAAGIGGRDSRIDTAQSDQGEDWAGYTYNLYLRGRDRHCRECSVQYSKPPSESVSGASGSQ